MCLAAVTLVLVLPILLLPLSSDNDIYQAMGFAFAEGKGLPYIGSWDHNFPGVVLYHWLGIKLFGLSDLAFRMIDISNRLGIAYLAYRIAHELFSKEVAWIAPILVVAHYVGAGLWNAGQRDGFATLWILIALLLSIKYDGNLAKTVLIAASIAVASMIRPTNLLFVLPLAGYLLFTKRWKMAAVYAGGFAVSILLLLTPWIFTTNGLSQFYYSAIRFNLDLYSPERSSWDNAFGSLYLYRFIAIGGVCGLALYVYRFAASRDISNRIGWLATYIVTAAVAILAMGKYHVYHFEILLPAWIFFTLNLIDSFESLRARSFIAISTATISVILYFPSGLVSQFVKNGGDAAARAQIARNLASFHDYSLQTEQAISARLAEYRIGDDDVEFALLWPGLRWRSGHPGLTRFTTSYALTLPSTTGMPEYQKQWISEYDSVLVAAKPSLIVAAHGPEYLSKQRGMSSDAFLHSLARFGGTLVTEYAIDTSIGGYNIYRRSDVAAIR